MTLLQILKTKDFSSAVLLQSEVLCPPHLYLLLLLLLPLHLISGPPVAAISVATSVGPDGASGPPVALSLIHI